MKPTPDIIINKKDDVYYTLEISDWDVTLDLSDYFTFQVPGYRFMPAYTMGTWDGRLRLYDLKTKEIYVGLLDKILEFASRRGLSVVYGFCEFKKLFDQNEVKTFMDSLKPHVSGCPIDPYDYQIDAVRLAINHSRGLLLSPTSSGKSLMIYSLVHWYLQEENKILIIVPTTSLVEQMYTDFEDYSSYKDPDFVEKFCHRIYSGKDHNTEKRVVISTWQSMHRKSKKYFDQFKTIIGDEAHLFKAKCLTSILHKMTDCPNKFGFTGTLDGTKTNSLVLEGLFGSIQKVITTKELMDSETISRLHIEAITLLYPEETRRHAKNLIYSEEINYIISNEARNKFIIDLALSRDKNTLVLYQLVKKHGQPLYEAIKKHDPNRSVFFISGNVKTEVREEVRKITEESTNAIIIASYGTYSTGINIRNLHNIIFAHPSKSRVRNLQSVGRGLRKSEGKTIATLFDISDDLSWKKRKNYSLKHFLERIKLYNSEKFDYTMRVLKL